MADVRELFDAAVEIVKTLWDEDIPGAEKLERGTALLVEQVEAWDDELVNFVPLPWRYAASALVDSDYVDSFQEGVCKQAIEAAYQAVKWAKALKLPFIG